MKEQLLNLYLKRQYQFKSIITQFPDDDLAGPFLMSPNSLYTSQENPLLIVGQETCGWEYSIDDLNKQMEFYEAFNVGIEYKATPFWNITRKVESALGNMPYSCAWTNISKFDLDGGRAYGKYEKAISGLDDLLVDEIKIIKPKVCLFFTGPSFDYRIQNIFKGVQYLELPNWTIRQFCQLEHPDLPEWTFRSYHPKSLRLRYLEEDFIASMAQLAVPPKRSY